MCWYGFFTAVSKIMQVLQHKTALITGSDSGIGRAIALEFARNGAKVIFTYHSDNEGAEAAAEEATAAGAETLVLKLDVSDETSVQQAFDLIQEKFGGLNILVNNAGVNGSGIPVAEMDTEVFDKTIRTNLYGTFFCSRAFVRQRLAAGKPGKIINISSVHESIASPGNSDYNASKAGIRNFSRCLALEVADKGIQVNNIAPGMILTPMNQEAMDDASVRKEKEQHIPMKRAGKPEEIAKLALFLASSDSDYSTGSTFYMDGGLTKNLGQGA